MATEPQPQSAPQDWSPCPAGALTNMVDARRARRRRKAIDRVAVVVASIMGCIALGGYTLGLFTPEQNGLPESRLSCKEVVSHLPAYIAGTLDEEFRTRMITHMHRCPSCQSRHDELAGDRVASGGRKPPESARQSRFAIAYELTVPSHTRHRSRRAHSGS
jgi:hypothetical protein